MSIVSRFIYTLQVLTHCVVSSKQNMLSKIIQLPGGREWVINKRLTIEATIDFVGVYSSTLVTVYIY